MAQTVKHAIIACHPEARSFTLSVAERYAQTVRAHGHEALIRDLYRMGFDPVLKARERRGEPGPDVMQEWAHLGKPDVYVLVYPIWFGTPPAMLKGYIDRVFGAGRTRGGPGQGTAGELLAGTRLVSLTSSGSMRAWLDEQGVLNSLRTVYDRYLAQVFGFCETHRFHSDGVTAEIPEREIQMHLLEVERAAREVMSRLVYPAGGEGAAGGSDQAAGALHDDGSSPASASLDRTIADSDASYLVTRAGVGLRLRPVTLKDGPRLKEFFARLTSDDLRFRFFDTKRTPSPDDIARMIEVDHRRSEHVLAFETGGGQLVATLMLVADQGMETAEVAVAVASAWKGRGIGWSLLRHACDLASIRGLKKIRSIESRANHDALEVEHALGFRSRELEDEPDMVLVEAELG